MKLRPVLRLSHEERMKLAKPAIVALWIFGITTLLVITGLSYKLDTSLVLGLRHKYEWLDPFLKITESPGQRRFVYPLAILLSLVSTYRRRDLLPTIATLAALIFTNAVTGVIKLMTLRGFPRTAGPEVFNTDFGDLYDLGAYPSGHAANIAAASTLMVLVAFSARPTYRKYIPHVLILTGLASVVTFVSSWLRDTHWVTDLVAGLSLGVATTIFAVLWALHLPNHWRHPELAGRPRIVIMTVGVLSLAGIFMFAANSFLSHSVTSVVMVAGVLGVIAWQSHQGVKRAIQRSRDAKESSN
jgi:membrane-associated phospholipid phosphatase